MNTLRHAEIMTHSVQESTVRVLCVGPINSNDLRHFFIAHDLDSSLF